MIFAETIRLSLLPAHEGPKVEAIPGEGVEVRRPESGQDAAVFDALLQLLSDAALLTDVSGRIRAANEAACALTGHSAATLAGRPLTDVLPRMDAAVLEFLAEKSASQCRVVVEATGRKSGNGEFLCEVEPYRVVRGEDGVTHLYLRIRPASRGADAPGVEARLARAERLEMAGTLAGQIAHDFNNFLTPLLAYPDLIRGELPPGSPAREFVDILEKTAGDMSRLTQQLLSLSRRGHIGQEVFSLNDVASDILRLLKPSLPEGIQVETELAADLLGARGSRDQMGRVVQNLCQNAIDAMGERGLLRLRTENFYLDAPVGQQESVNVGEYVKLTIEDTGSGVAPEIRDRIFDPFFTTKRGSGRRGTGLGLSIVHGIVKDHGGYVDLESEPGRGTRFHVYLPICRDVPAKPTAEALPRGNESLLVVDDDAPQLDMLVEMLRKLGYAATGARSGEAALDLVGRQGVRYDLVILDMVLTLGMDGLKAFSELRKLVPDQKVLLVSGFTRASRTVTLAQQQGAGAYLRKPLTAEQVARAVRRELDGPRAEAERAGPRRVLIVDNEHLIRRLFGLIVTSEFPGVAVDQASNGLEAIESFRVHRQDVLILDLQMPVVDGREAFQGIEQICQRNGWRVPPVIFCTGYAAPESLASIVADGSYHRLLRKPVRAENLVQAIRERLEE